MQVTANTQIWFGCYICRHLTLFFHSAVMNEYEWNVLSSLANFTEALKSWGPSCPQPHSLSENLTWEHRAMWSVDFSANRDLGEAKFVNSIMFFFLLVEIIISKLLTFMGDLISCAYRGFYAPLEVHRIVQEDKFPLDFKTVF